eukprot:CAMPEP_0178593514 /NCGR_PEP_ID=MMETSP0697-20121206/29973_1 /TAXON_ID=265572 /ORGANISM="Extubocellulus spinifer, Strain CCMP396" /LENGTH=173 /DNA_ID=CAMNT_0020230667 /DNA_START=373 /DNA_END=897 /DNA_ORIENTATION=+
MHELLAEKGFEKKSEEEVRKMKEGLASTTLKGKRPDLERRPNPKVVVKEPVAAVDTRKAEVSGGEAAAGDVDGEDEDDDDEDDDDDDDDDTSPVDTESAKVTTSDKAASAHVRKVKVKKKSKGSHLSNTPSQFVLVVSTICILFFALSRKFPVVRILMIPITRLVGCRHRHAR